MIQDLENTQLISNQIEGPKKEKIKIGTLWSGDWRVERVRLREEKKLGQLGKLRPAKC